MNKRKKVLIKGCTTILALLITTSPILKELHEYKQVDKIKKSENIEGIPRSFKNIKQDKMGDYLKDTINYLYEKYPNLDELIYLDNELTHDKQFLDDIYLLYKAQMVDSCKTKDQKIDINDVSVTVSDHIIANSDMISVNDTKLRNTFREQDKFVTDMFISQNEFDKYDGTKLAERIYEYLVLEHGLTENTLTSKQIQERIEKDGFYYDVSSERFYTKRGIEKLQLIDDAELLPELSEEMYQDNSDQEPEL